MCARHQDLQRAISEAVEAHAIGRDRQASAEAVADGGSGPRRRIALWEQTDNVHCSIVGTCASVEDLRRVARKAGIDVSPDTPDYDVHGHFVRMSTTDNVFSRAFQKLLDQRYEGALRRVARVRDADDLGRLWREMCERGQVAPAYWSFMTLGHVPARLRVTIFGEVHMLSHLAGASFRQKTAEATTLRDQLAEADDRARRVEAGLKQALVERDREIAELRAALTALKGEREGRPPAAAEEAGTAAEIALLRRRLAKSERAIQTARARARLAEARLSELERDQDAASARLQAGETGEPAAPSRHRPPVIAGPPPDTTTPRAILYVGGMHGHRDRLRGIAEAFNATFVHHDGGVEDAPQRLDSLLPSVDCVFCPVNCVSHDACLRAKKICQKLNKPFVPLRSSGQSAFRKALQSLVSAPRTSQITLDRDPEGDAVPCISR